MSNAEKIQELSRAFAQRARVEKTVKCAHVVTALVGLEALRRKLNVE